ncbi:uncharacterized protein LOC142166986 [Nicotiana tabacum]|uniref:Uncharacterized protein LOC142166986 n=1 Tax=Nicotiana tabacum TaxID=4097 RepID=A0AC58SE44_TOBAC
MAMLEGLLDILRLGERDAYIIGKQNFLPSSFIGGPRDMRQRFMDAIAPVQHFGKPDLFITMTCNPSWTEIKEHLIPTDESHNRHDLISRVFREKIEEFEKDILKRNIFGKVAAFMYTIKFQKRGLPHAHFLIILTNEYKILTPEAYDNIISAEIPDENAEPDLHSLVLKHMMHDPCGNLNPTNSCIKKKGYCKFKYPKGFADQTSKGIESYPIYRRRNTRSSANVDTLVNNPLIKQTMLTQFFEMNRTNVEAMELNLLYQEFPEHFVWSSTEKMWTPRKQRHVIGRVVTCHPTEGERYYLRMLLMNIRGPKSYKDLLTVNGERCSTFRESVGLQSDNSLLECMSEAASYQMPYSLRRLFATLLIYCNPTNPRQLWEQFEEHMSEDYTLNIDQLKAYNIITERIFSNKAGAFFIDGPGGTGKTFLYRVLLATVRYKGYIALATATSGVAASILPSGRIAHSRFKIPINTYDNVSYNISKQSSLACLIQDAKLIIWDEVSMAEKK